MRIAEISGKYQVPLTNEEADFLGKLPVDKSVLKKELTDRDQLLANQLVVKDVLIRKVNNGQVSYKQSNRSSLV